MKRHPRRTTTVMKKMAAAMMIIMLLLSSVSASASSAAGQYNGTESDYNNPEKYLMYCKLEDFYRKVERGSYSSYDLAWEISKYNVNRVEEDDGKAWSRFCQNQGDTAFKKYQLGYGLGRSTYRVLSGEPTLLDINICSVSNCVNFLNAVFGQKFSASDFEWFEYYLGFNYANCNYYRSDLCRETRKDTAIHEITVRGVRYYYITDTYDDMDPEFTGSWKYYTDFQNRSWNWVDAICIIGDYFYEIQYAYTPGAYGLTDAESVMKTIGSFTYYPEYEHGLAACRTPDITGKCDHGTGVGYMEYMAVLAGQRSTRHCEGGSSAGSIARHRLVNHDAVIEGGVSVAFGVVSCEIAVVQRDRIQPFDANAFGQGGDQFRVLNRDIGCGIDSRGPQSV